MYDIIGDIHGYAGPLKKLLEKLGYTENDGAWHHPHSKVIFVGDYIDRGPAIRETLQIVKSMADNGNAIALMGNHEYNAMAFHYENPTRIPSQTR
jgi:predicted MPP superfamily phosphohydrolase